MGGGAERTASSLHELYRRMNQESWLAVGAKASTDPFVLEIPNEAYRNSWVRWWSSAVARYDAGDAKVRGLGRFARSIRDLGQPQRLLRHALGIDDFDYPGTAHLLQLPPSPPDLLHIHNLHGNYFDLRCLADLALRTPTVLTLHDAWTISGHCAFSLGCERWRTGCGNCPDLQLYPSIKRDGTAHNWVRKQQIFSTSKLYVASPSHWLMGQVQQSIIAPAMIEQRVIPNGIDTDTFCPGDKDEARRYLNIPPRATVLLTVAKEMVTNRWKDFDTLRSAIGKTNRELLLLVVGEERPAETVGLARIEHVPFQTDQAALARYYRAADIYVHAARIESFGNVLLEARACATPVIATAVGAIPEHLKGLAWPFAPGGLPVFHADNATGLLTAPGDSDALAAAIQFALQNPELRQALGRNGFLDTRTRFTLQAQATAYLDWYREILSREAGTGRRSARVQHV
jgi:glycosyltransferase involved in cell wall biosynthesis